LQIQVGASASGAPNKKPHRTSRRLQLMACRVAAQVLGLGAAADNATLPRSSGLQMNRRRHNFRLPVIRPGIRTFRLFGATEALR
jgi:hypothetical protein